MDAMADPGNFGDGETQRQASINYSRKSLRGPSFIGYDRASQK